MASKNSNIQLPDSSEFIQCMTFNFRLLFAISMFFILWSILMSCLNSIKLGFDDNIIYEPVKLNGMSMMCGCNKTNCACKSIEQFENFSNDEMYSYKKSPSSSYQSIPLVAKDDENLLFGQANRFIMIENDPVFEGQGQGPSKITYRLEIYCNLFVLGGNIFNQKLDQQMYKVYLINSKTGEVKYLNNLTKDNDGMYKLKYKTTNDIEKLVKYDQINIVYTLNKDEQLLLSGKFH